MAERKIAVKLPVAQWDALYQCAQGELDSLTEADWESGLHDHLSAALETMRAARSDAATTPRRTAK